MEIFNKSKDKAVRLKSHHNKFLLATSDGENAITQHGSGNTTASRWKVEFVPQTSLIRLKSVNTSLYLSVSDKPSHVGSTAKKVVQAGADVGVVTRASLEWVPVKEGVNGRVMLRAITGTFLVANGSLAPWRNAVTHDMLCSTKDVDWAVWIVEVVDEDPKKDEEEAKKKKREELRRSQSEVGDKGSHHVGVIRSVRTLSPQRSKNTMLTNSFNNRGLPPEIQMAKQTFMEVQDIDFKLIFSSEKLKRIETAISIVLSYINHNNQRGLATKSKLTKIQDQLQTLKSEQKRCTNELTEYEVFQERKECKIVELQREVGKARELEMREKKSLVALEKTRGKREELLKEMEKVKREMKKVEEEKVKNEDEMEKLFRVIARRNEGVKTMERDESVWMKKEAMAKRTIMEVEGRWDIVKASF